ncbi:MAG TPA: phenylalanine--tRNA ligase subunit beta [Clostridiaceae bacterium]|nr:phenylalanine--tRNA ligase subunit beta [Clostridiaceae bacterium]
MKVPVNWLKDFVDIDVEVEELVEAMTMSGSKVEGVESPGEEISKVVAGKILQVEKHPNADKLLVCQVDVGNETIQVLTGAKNVKAGDIVPVALDGSTLPGGIKIKKGKMRGLESNGMMCSIGELNLSKDDYPEACEDGIFILNPDVVPGTDIKDVLGLNEVVIDFEITSNRPDCLSVLGIAREAAVALEKPFRKPEIIVKEEDDSAEKYASVEIKDTDLCARFAARILKDVKIEPSPEWMRNRLKAAGIRPINNIVDITNYVMLELGQPMHAYDLENIEGGKIIVRRAADGEILKTLDDQDRKLDSSMLVIADAVKPLGVAGVMGGANSEIKETTKTILLECANFDGISVRLTAKKLGMRTEASSRFEKGLDVENVITAINRASQLAIEMGAAKVCSGIIDCYPRKAERRSIKLRPDRINAFLGTSISTEYMIKILRALEFEVDEANMTVTVPSFRLDVEREADLAEEIARFYGYNNIQATLLEGKSATLGKKSYKQKLEDLIKDTMISCGMYEIYTYSFTSPKVLDALNVPEDSELRKAVVISNPLGEDYSIMRTTTIPSMLDAISRNYNRRIESARLFEMSFVYIPESLPVTELPHEKEILTLGIYGNADFYDIKGVVEELLDVLGIKRVNFQPESDNPTFHPGRTASIMIKGQKIGTIGQIHPEVAEKFECPEDTYIGVLEVEKLIENADMDVEYKPLPKFPAVTRDIAMLVKDEILVKQIEDVISSNSGNILEDMKLFDVYKGKQIPEGMKSVAYSITFRGQDRTLTDDEVNAVMQKIIDGLKDKLGAQLR